MEGNEKQTDARVLGTADVTGNKTGWRGSLPCLTGAQAGTRGLPGVGQPVGVGLGPQTKPTLSNNQIKLKGLYCSAEQGAELDALWREHKLLP